MKGPGSSENGGSVAEIEVSSPYRFFRSETWNTVWTLDSIGSARRYATGTTKI
jgi:hypothetical protein